MAESGKRRFVCGDGHCMDVVAAAVFGRKTLEGLVWL